MLPQDKANHVIAGALVNLALQWLCVLFGFEVLRPQDAGLVVAVVAGAVKEWLDPRFGGTRDWGDFAATAGGALMLRLAHG